MHPLLQPVPSVSPEALLAGKRWLVWDAAWASITGAWSGGVVLVAFALDLGAEPMTIGLLAAIPFLAQAAQLPSIFLVERIRNRKLIGVTAVTVARVLVLLLAWLPFMNASELRIPLLVSAHVLIAVLGSAIEELADERREVNRSAWRTRGCAPFSLPSPTDGVVVRKS
ncbi:MAG: hypothetical protein H0T52_07595 [Lautropia sp.]|nr:hypothetical protein [Lautropia sp.]